MSQKGYLIEYDWAHEALESLRPTIVTLINEFGGSQGFVVVSAGTDRFPFLIDSRIVGTVGEDEKWKYPYDKIAAKKTEMALREKMGTGDILSQPQRLLTGDIPFRGGIYKEGWAVGVSGLEEDEDVIIARLIIEFFIMKVKRRSKEVLQQLSKKDSCFLE